MKYSPTTRNWLINLWLFGPIVIGCSVLWFTFYRVFHESRMVLAPLVLIPIIGFMFFRLGLQVKARAGDTALPTGLILAIFFGICAAYLCVLATFHFRMEATNGYSAFIILPMAFPLNATAYSIGAAKRSSG